MKTCCRCDQTLDYSAFNKDNSRPDKVNCACRACVAEYRKIKASQRNEEARSLYQADLELSRRLRRLYYQANKKKVLATNNAARIRWRAKKKAEKEAMGQATPTDAA